jgi:hypothetical protein
LQRLTTRQGPREAGFWTWHGEFLQGVRETMPLGVGDPAVGSENCVQLSIPDLTTFFKYHSLPSGAHRRVPATKLPSFPRD